MSPLYSLTSTNFVNSVINETTITNVTIANNNIRYSHFYKNHFLKFPSYQNIDKLVELDGVAPLMTDPPPTSSTPLSKKKINK